MGRGSGFNWLRVLLGNATEDRDRFICDMAFTRLRLGISTGRWEVGDAEFPNCGFGFICRARVEEREYCTCRLVLV